MSAGTASATLRRLDRAAITRWLPQLDEWLLPGAFYGVLHTWPQLYRSDGGGAFFVLTSGDRLLSHCAVRVVTARGAAGPLPTALLGSVATDPAERGQGFAGRVLAAALAECRGIATQALLWAERADLYARHGFVAGGAETVLALVRRPRRDAVAARLATVRDHGELHALHERKPWRVERSPGVMSGLLTTPGMATVVLERDGAVVAYACYGKGADLQNHWHEVGGDDEDVALLLPAAMHVVDQVEGFVLLPPYRPRLRELLGRAVAGELAVPGPMVCAFGGQPTACWIDGLDSV
jgi:predicted N-acetyltransferase YhbS